MVDTTGREIPPTTPGSDAGDQPGQPGAPGGPMDTPAGEDAPVGLRVGRNPGNLGDDVPGMGDVTYPSPAPEAVPEI